MTDREILETILVKMGNMNSRMTGIEANMATKKELAEVKTDLAGVKTELSGVKTELAEVKADVIFIKRTVVKIENDHGEKTGSPI